MTLWEMDESEPLITPARMLDYYREMLGAQVDALALPDLLVATFQKLALERMADRLEGQPPTRWPAPAFWPLARGSFEGRALAVARLPVGAPAAVFALELMIAAGVRTVLLVGSAGSLQPHLQVGSLVIATEATRHEGCSHHYLPSGVPAASSPPLVDALLSSALRQGVSPPAKGPLWTTDAPFRECIGTVALHREAGVLAVDMEAAALFALAAHRRIRVALIAAISDQLDDGWKPAFHTLAYRRALLSAVDVALEAAVHLPASL